MKDEPVLNKNLSGGLKAAIKANDLNQFQQLFSKLHPYDQAQFIWKRFMFGGNLRINKIHRKPVAFRQKPL